MFCDCVAVTFVLSAVSCLFFFLVSLVGLFCDYVALTCVLFAVSFFFFCFFFLLDVIGRLCSVIMWF